jgi:hypothetical protein
VQKIVQGLEEAGFPFNQDADHLVMPDLGALIMACGEKFGYLRQEAEGGSWEAAGGKVLDYLDQLYQFHFTYSDPKMSVANLFIAIKKTNA